MARPKDTPPLASLEEAIVVLFCLIDDAYALLNPKGQDYEPLKKLSDSEVLTLALFQQLRGIESERSFLRDVQRFFVHLFPGAAGMCTPLLVAPPGEEAEALAGGPAPPGPARVGGRA